MAGYTPLFSSIVTSSIWNEESATRIVWITMLALADYQGKVEGSISGLAPVARVSLDECVRALDKLQSPDPYSRTQEHEGRRIKPVDGGWQILNFAKFRDKAKSRAAYYRLWKKEKNQKKEEKPNTNEDEDVNINKETKRNIRATGATVAQEQEKTTTSSPKESKSHKGTSLKRIISAWQKLPLPPEKKEFAAADLLVIERAISILAGDSQEPVHEGMILEAIENYRQALSLPDSQTYKHKLHPWLMEHIRKYVSYNFNIDDHRGSRFSKKAKSSDDALAQLKAEGRLP